MRFVRHACPHPPNLVATAVWLIVLVALGGWLVSRGSLAYLIAGLAVVPAIFLIAVENFTSRVIVTSAEAARAERWSDAEVRHVYSHLCSGRNSSVAFAGLIWAIAGSLIVQHMQHGGVLAGQALALAGSVSAVWVAVWLWAGPRLRGFEKNPHAH